MKSNLSCTYRLLRRIGLNYPEEEYGQVTLGALIGKVLNTYHVAFLTKFVFDSWLLSPILHRKVRPWVLRRIGAKVGKDVFIGTGVWIDTGNANLITMEDHSHLDGGCVVLCHKRQLDQYCVGDDYAKLPYKKAPVVLKKGCSVGTASILMPGVTIGEGAIVGAGSLVTKDIPAWTIAVGHPAVVVRTIPCRDN